MLGFTQLIPAPQMIVGSSADWMSASLPLLMHLVAPPLPAVEMVKGLMKENREIWQEEEKNGDTVPLWVKEFLMRV